MFRVLNAFSTLLGIKSIISCVERPTTSRDKNSMIPACCVSIPQCHLQSRIICFSLSILNRILSNWSFSRFWELKASNGKVVISSSLFVSVCVIIFFSSIIKNLPHSIAIY